MPAGRAAQGDRPGLVLQGLFCSLDDRTCPVLLQHQTEKALTGELSVQRGTRKGSLLKVALTYCESNP